MDGFSKMAHFFPCSQIIDALYMAKLFLKGIVGLHYLPTTNMSGISIKDIKFVSYFRKLLGNCLGLL